MSASLGRHAARHGLEAKIAALREAGYHGIEIHFECLQNEARRLFSLDSAVAPCAEQLYAAARSVRARCEAASLQIICLEPFLHYPGLLPTSRRDERLAEVPMWFTLADLLGTDMIQVASAMFGGPFVSNDESRIVEDLTILADMGLRWPRPKFWAYEAMCFGHCTTTWEQAWRQVQRVDRPNFGIVMDTFQILGAIYADPTSVDGKHVGADEAVEATLTKLRDTFEGPANAANRSKIFFMQLGDARKMDPPLSEESDIFDASQHANVKMCWARMHRLFPGEGYMPAQRIAQVILQDCGWRGWVSAEYFNADTFTDDAAFPAQAACRCRKGHDEFIEAMQE
ncbi:uncharacterized protein PFL1_00212 [Pseudozyma flocculosa PF-1]|uniref:Related to dehydroshikimate dehydratase n=1 Tax=Pseudozyma flocculosa TaxID=84751 RepID=A0A5C3ESQ4_9BASI|nr:uncharacterized protein PFL1_00212 [Pseudozyma flocculosa PF-1]EPQ32014.1 hypothetical protein PFL1_00212 [Pseudozyma flocculosa PF-1]SPO35062.1 related to dehydroshikimate dehydratase [Pseudozyma flocculosa]